VIHNLTANIGHVQALSLAFFEGRMLSRLIVTNITPARGTLHCRKTRIPCRDQLVICGLYIFRIKANYLQSPIVSLRRIF
jgi:hypothetical protein